MWRADFPYHWLQVFVDGEYDHQEHCRCAIDRTHYSERKSQAALRQYKAAHARKSSQKKKAAR